LYTNIGIFTPEGFVGSIFNSRTVDNVDIGDVDRVGNEFIIVREGVVNVHMYYIPKAYITKYDGSSLWIDVSSGLVSTKFERENEPTQEEIDMLMNEVPD
jgi:hypothetical protein